MLFERVRDNWPVSGSFTGLVFLLCLGLSGCSNNTDSSSSVDSNTSSSAFGGGETEAEACRKKLSGAIRRLNAERMALQSDPERSINGLNSWIASCASDEVADRDLDEAALAMLNSNTRAIARRYTGADATYIRDAFLLRDLTSALASRRSDATADAVGRETARVMQTFEWVMRHISLLPDDVQRPPLGLFDVLLIGRGTAADRAWALAEALRQQQIDAVLVNTDQPPESEGSLLDTAGSLVAVIQNDTGFLLDVATGLPVTAGAELDLQTPVPAPLAVLKEHPRWKDSTVQVIAQVATFAPRMLVLQENLAAEDAAVLYEELTGGVSEIRPLIERITASAEIWTADDVSIWSYPEDRVIAAQSFSEEQLQEYALLKRAFDAPFERQVYQPESVEELTTVPEALSDEERQRLAQERLMQNFIRVNQSSEEMFGKPSRRLLKARIQQIQGSIDSEVIQQLQQIRIASMEERIRIAVPQEYQQQQGLPPVIVLDLPKVIREVNQSSTGDSMYWTALCQMDRGEVGAAITTFSNYRRQYPNGKWWYPSMVNQALAFLEQQRVKDAVAVLEQANQEENPSKQRVQRMLTALAQP